MKRPEFSALLTGILLTIVAGTVLAGMDAVGKHLTTLMPVLQVLWGRYLFQTVAISGYLVSTTGTGFLKTRHPVLQIVRGLLLLAASILMYQALVVVPLADATAVLFFNPIVVTLLSVVILREKIGVHRVTAVIAGFLGILLIIRPGFSNVEPRLFLALGASVVLAGYLLLTRHLAGGEDAASTQFNTTAFGTVVLSILVLPNWQPIDGSNFLLLVAIGIAGAAGHFLLIRAFSHAPASTLAPFLYAQVLAAAVFSLVLLGDPLRPTMMIGTAMLVASGVYIWWRERLKDGSLT